MTSTRARVTPPTTAAGWTLATLEARIGPAVDPSAQPFAERVGDPRYVLYSTGSQGGTNAPAPGRKTGDREIPWGGDFVQAWKGPQYPAEDPLNLIDWLNPSEATKDRIRAAGILVDDSAGGLEHDW